MARGSCRDCEASQCMRIIDDSKVDHHAEFHYELFVIDAMRRQQYLCQERILLISFFEKKKLLLNCP